MTVRESGFSDLPGDIREQMIRETNAFLSWSLAQDRDLPRIATRRVDQGGFDFLYKNPGAMALARRWWKQVLSDQRLQR